MNVCLLCLCPGHTQTVCQKHISCTWYPPNMSKHNTILCTQTTEADIIEQLRTKHGKINYMINFEMSIFSWKFEYEEMEAGVHQINLKEEE